MLHIPLDGEETRWRSSRLDRTQNRRFIASRPHGPIVNTTMADAPVCLSKRGFRAYTPGISGLSDSFTTCWCPSGYVPRGVCGFRSSRRLGCNMPGSGRRVSASSSGSASMIFQPIKPGICSLSNSHHPQVVSSPSQHEVASHYRLSPTLQPARRCRSSVSSSPCSVVASLTLSFLRLNTNGNLLITIQGGLVPLGYVTTALTGGGAFLVDSTSTKVRLLFMAIFRSRSC